MKKIFRVLLVIIIFIVIGLFVGWVSNMQTGEKAKFHVEGEDWMSIFATNEKALDLWTDGDRLDAMFILENGLVHLIEANTMVLILERTTQNIKFRILEGEYYGEIGWTRKENIIPI